MFRGCRTPGRRNHTSSTEQLRDWWEGLKTDVLELCACLGWPGLLCCELLGSNNRHLFLTFLEAGIPRSRCQPLGFLVYMVTHFLLCLHVQKMLMPHLIKTLMSL